MVSELNVSEIFHIDCRPSGQSMTKFHRHNVDELVIVEHGTSKVLVEQGIFRESGAYAIFYPRNAAHQQINDLPHEQWCINYQPGFLDGVMPQEEMQKEFFMVSLDAVEVWRIKRLCEMLLDAYTAREKPPTEANCRRWRYLLAALLNELAEPLKRRDALPWPHTSIDRVIHNICRYIDTHIAEPMTLDSIAKAFFISRSKLARRFHEILGITVGEYITGLRMDRAKRELARGKSVQETAELCGYSTAGYFIKVFAREVGMTPAKYRASVRGQKLL